MLESLKQSIDGLKTDIVNGIAEGIKNGIISFFKWVGLGIINNSYWICLMACLIALFMYLAGFKKAGKYVSLSIIIFYILQSLKVFFV